MVDYKEREWPDHRLKDTTFLAQDPPLQFFSYDHLRADLASISSPFAVMADFLVSTLPHNPERTTALRKLLEAKDCAVRAGLFKS